MKLVYSLYPSDRAEGRMDFVFELNIKKEDLPSLSNRIGIYNRPLIFKP